MLYCKVGREQNRNKKKRYIMISGIKGLDYN